MITTSPLFHELKQIRDCEYLSLVVPIATSIQLNLPRPCFSNTCPGNFADQPSADRAVSTETFHDLSQNHHHKTSKDLLVDTYRNTHVLRTSKQAGMDTI